MASLKQSSEQAKAMLNVGAKRIKRAKNQQKAKPVDEATAKRMLGKSKSKRGLIRATSNRLGNF